MPKKPGKPAFAQRIADAVADWIIGDRPFSPTSSPWAIAKDARKQAYDDARRRKHLFNPEVKPNPAPRSVQKTVFECDPSPEMQAWRDSQKAKPKPPIAVRSDISFPLKRRR